MNDKRRMVSDELVNDEQRADKRLSDWWLREEEKKSGQRLRIRISIAPLTDGYSSTPRISHSFFTQYSEPRNSLLKLAWKNPCGIVDFFSVCSGIVDLFSICITNWFY